MSGLFQILSIDQLLDLGFLVHHVLTNHGIVFLHLHFSGSILFILVRGVKVTGFSGRHQADFIS
jgi:hypothetical protein